MQSVRLSLFIIEGLKRIAWSCALAISFLAMRLLVSVRFPFWFPGVRGFSLGAMAWSRFCTFRAHLCGNWHPLPLLELQFWQ
jgi:hypothetical protein